MLSQLSISDLGEALSLDQSLASVFPTQPPASDLHLILVDLGSPLPIRCFIRGTSDMLKFQISQTDSDMVFEFLNRIKETSPALDGESVDHLSLYKASYRDDHNLEEILQKRGEGQLLAPGNELQVVFKNSLFCETTCIIVEVLHREHKRSLEAPTWDVVERATKRSKMLDIFPLGCAGVEQYRAQQANMDERILDYRIVEGTDKNMLPDQKLPPIEVLYAGFGQFIETYHSQCESNVIPGGSAVMRANVEKFTEEMSKIYEDDEERQNHVLTGLNCIFGNALRTYHQVIAPSPMGLPTDAFYCSGSNTMNLPCIVVSKGEDADSEVIPVIQLCAYYEHMVANVAEANENVVRCSKLPMLGMTIVGPMVTFYALAYVGSVTYTPLTSGLWCSPNSHGGNDQCALLAAFAAASVLLTQINQHAEEVTNVHSPAPPLRNHFFPDIKELPSLQDPNVSIHFQITSILQSGQYQHLYHATSSQLGHDLVIKITHSYSTALHQFCAAHGHAPALHSVAELPGNIIVVAMDYVEGVHLGPDLPQELQDKVSYELRQLVNDFHAAGYVHGDLRSPNILCANDTFMLLDFDWGGEVGKAHYPWFRLNLQLAEGRDMNDLMITKGDDERVLQKTLEDEQIGFLP